MRRLLVPQSQRHEDNVLRQTGGAMAVRHTGLSQMASPKVSMTIRVQNRQRAVAIHTTVVKQRAQQIMAYLSCTEKELSVVFGSDRLLHTLNRTYRHKDRPTNVLAFPQHPTYEGEPATAMLGDVIISLPTAAREACVLQQTLEERVVYLLLHGILHLLGYDHEHSVAQRRCMEALERRVLAHLRG